MNISQKGINLIKQFEGLRLEAYQCSAGVWPIGYGHTGSDVFKGTVASYTKRERRNLKNFLKSLENIGLFRNSLNQTILCIK